MQNNMQTNSAYFYIFAETQNPMATTRFYLDLRGKAKDGKGTILITIFHNHSTTSITTGVRVNKSDWDGTRVVSCPGAEAMNSKINHQKSKIDRALALLELDDRFEHMTASEIKNEIVDGKPKRVQGHLLSDLFQEYIDNGDLKEGTKAIYQSTLKKIEAFGPGLRIESLSLKWLRSFDQYLAKTQSANGRSIYLRSLRAVCNYARHNDIHFSYPFENFQIKQEPTRKRSIAVDELRRFMDFPTTPSNQKYRDYFFLSFYLIGINSKDLLLAKKSQVVNGRLEYVREKTNKKYSIKIEPEAWTLIDRYSGSGDFLLEAMDHCKHYRSFAHEWNDALKTIGETVEVPTISDDLFAEPVIEKKIKPIIPGISTYFARHTWATIASELDISSDVIAQALGHSNTNRTTMIYIKPDQNKVDEANRSVIDYLLNY